MKRRNTIPVRLNTEFLQPLQRKSLEPVGIEHASNVNPVDNVPLEDTDDNCGEDGDCQETNLIELN
jgi:hypothetical protein